MDMTEDSLQKLKMVLNQQVCQYQVFWKIEHHTDSFLHIVLDLGSNIEVKFNLRKLAANLEPVWVNIPIVRCQRLVKSMPDRIQVIIDTCSGYTKY